MESGDLMSFVGDENRDEIDSSLSLMSINETQQKSVNFDEIKVCTENKEEQIYPVEEKGKCSDFLDLLFCCLCKCL